MEILIYVILPFQPDFGMIIKTPPSDRKIYPLIETTVTEPDQTSSIEEDGADLLFHINV